MPASDLATSDLAADGLAPPVGYSGWWVVLGVALVVLVVAWYGWVFWSTRHRRDATPHHGVGVRVDVTTARADHLARVQQAAAAYGRGELDARGLYQQLSVIVRDYATALGHPASAATLAELDVRGPQPLATTVRGYYPAEFAPDDDGDPHAAVAAAVHLVGTWP